MHVCLICSFLDGSVEIGGIEQHVRYLSEGLSQTGFKVTVMTSDLDPRGKRRRKPKSKIGDGKIRLIRLKTLFNPLNNPITPSIFLKLMSQNDYDIIHCHDYYYFGSFVAAYLKKIRKKPLVSTVHTSPISYSNLTSKMVRSSYDFFFSRFILESSDRIIVLSKSLQKYILEKGIPPSKIRHIFNGINFDEFSGSNNNSFSTDYKSNKLLFVGRLVERKGVNVLLKALKNISIRIGDKVSLTVIGDGPQRKNLEESCKDLGICSQVKFLGNVDKTELVDFYRSCDIFILPSISGEVQPFVLFEAMSLKKPFIATKVGGIPDLKEEGIFGYYIEPNNSKAIEDAVIDYLTKRNFLKDKFALNESIARKKFSVDEMINKTIKVYEEFI